MKLTDKQLAEFQRLFFEDTGIELSNEQALEQAIKLITLTKVISKAINNYYEKIYE